MPRPPERRWPAIAAGYLVLLLGVAIPTAVLYRFAEPTYRPALLRSAATLVLGVVLLHGRALARRSLESEPPSSFDEALEPASRRAVVDRSFRHLRDELRFSARSQAYFAHILWPRLAALDRRLGRDRPLTRPAGRRWLRRGPSLRSLGELVTILEQNRSRQ